MRRKDIDILKGIAIIAVVLYHAGLLSNGYLGVDVFFVISGYLSVPSIIRKVCCHNSLGGYVRFLQNRAVRLIPLVTAACMLCIFIGAYGMLPDDYENLSESALASLFFSNNILANITTKNYWNVINDYKPLMHTWYLGVLMEFYVLFPLCVMAVSKWQEKGVKRMVYVLTLTSLALYILPFFKDSSKFYLIPFRFFEFGVGGIVAFYQEGLKRRYSLEMWGGLLGLYALLLILCSGWSGIILAPMASLLLVVAVSVVILISNMEFIKNNVLAMIGRMSLSIYIWHQIILAFFRYYNGKDFGLQGYLVFLTILAILSIMSYIWMEQKIRLSKRTLSVIVFSWMIAMVPAATVYLHAGVIRDVPELGVCRDNVHRGMFAEYCDRVYNYDNPFDNSNRAKVLVIGNSFARDWCNVLLESKYRDSISLSYAYASKETLEDESQKKKIADRLKEADIVFLLASLFELRPFVEQHSLAPVFGISDKNFGESNGMVYVHRDEPEYFSSTLACKPEVLAEYAVEKSVWGGAIC